MKGFLVTIAFLVIGAATYFGPNISKHFGVRYEEARRKTFEESQSYIHGAKRNLTKMMYEYKTANKAHKVALRELMLSEASTIDMSKLPIKLRNFVNSLD